MILQIENKSVLIHKYLSSILITKTPYSNLKSSLIDIISLYFNIYSL